MEMLRRAASLAVAAAVLSASVCGLVPGAAPLPAASAAPSATSSVTTSAAAVVPVILVGDWGGPQTRAWGALDPQAGGLYGRLCRAGFSPGRTLFVLDDASVRGAGGLDAARAALRDLIALARRASGALRVDIVTYGAGALLARACAEGAAAPVVRNVVMIAPPNRGSSFFAWVRLAGEIERQSRPLSPPLDEAGDAATGEAGPSGGFDTATYVTARVAATWAALYEEYLQWLLVAQPETATTTRPSFEAWLMKERPSCFAENITGAAAPPVAPPAAAAAGGPPYVQPAEGTGLSRAFYELLAINVARCRALERAGGGAGLLQALKTPSLLEQGASKPWQRWLWRIAAWFGRQLQRFARARGPAVVTVAAAHRDGIDPCGRYADALVPEVLSLPGCAAGGYGDLRVPANVWLERWNAWEEGRRAARDVVPAFDAGLEPHPNPRYIVIAGRLPVQIPKSGLPPAFTVPPAGDLVVAPADTLLSPCANDVFIPVSGLLALHPALPLARGVQDEVLRWLTADYPAVTAYSLPGGGGVADAFGPRWEARDNCTVVATRPAYVSVDGRQGAPLPGLTLRLDVEVQSPRQSWVEVRGWAYVQDRGSGVVTRREISFANCEGLLGGGLEFSDFGLGAALVRLGLRAFPAGPAGARAAATGQVEGLAATLRLSYGPAGDAPAGPEQATDTPPTAPASGAPPAAGGSPADGTPSGEGDAWGDPIATPGTGVAPAPGVGPLIRVKLRTKHTTLVREAHHQHVRWEWDFGDGGGMTDADPTHTTCTVRHRFAAPGHYVVSAASYDAGGKLLCRLTWSVDVPAPPPGEEGGAGSGAGDGMERELTAQAPLEPGVAVNLDGPREWMAGIPAQYWVRVSVTDPPGGRSRVVDIDPGPAFQVLWERPGHYLVQVAVTVETTYEVDGKAVRLRSTWVYSWPVTVLAPALGA